MADFLGGLLSGGGGLYDDLLTPQQQSQLSSRGLLSMAGAFADAAMPSRFPVPLGAAIGKAAAAMSGGRDEAALKLLQGQKLSQEVQTMKMTSALQQQFMKDIQTLPLDALFKRYNIGGATTAAPTTSPLPAEPNTAPLSAAPNADPAAPTMPAIPSIYSNPPRQNLSPYTGLRPFAPATIPPSSGGPPTAAERAAWIQSRQQGGQDTIEDWVAKQRAGAPAGTPGPSAPTPDDPAAGASLNDRYGGILAMAGGPGGASGSSLPPQDELIRQSAGPGGLLQASYTGAPPFGQIPGAGGDEVGSGGDTSSPEYLAKRARDLALVEKYESGGRNIEQQVVGPQGGYNPSVGRVTGPSSASGYRQMIDSTWRSAARDAGIDTALYPRAIDAPRELQQKAAEALYDKRGLADWAPYNRALARAVGWSGPTGDGFSGGGAAPGASGGAPAAAGGDGQGMNTLLLELAKRNAMAEILKLGNPYSSMLSVLQGSPEYKGQIAGAEAKATQPFTQENATHASQLKILEDMAKDNMTVDKNGNIVLLPEAQRIRTMNAEQQAEAKAKWEAPQEQPVYSPDGTIKIEKMNTFEFRRREADKARRAALGDTMPRPGDLAQTPYYRPGQAEQETQAAQAKQQLAPNGILVNDGKGGTRRVQATVAQAAAAARGEPVPELRIQGLLQPGQASQGAAPPAGTVASEPVYSETEKAIGANAARAFGEQRTAAQSAAEQIKINNESLRLLDSGLYTGWDANLALGMGRIFGIQGKDTAEKVQNTQLFVLQRMQQAADAVRAQPGSASDKDLAFMNRMSLGDITLEPSTIRQGMEIYNRFHLERIREHNRNAAGIAPGVTSGIRQTVDEPPPYERNQGNTPGGNRWQRPPGQ